MNDLAKGDNETAEGRRDRFFFFNDTATTEIYTLSLHDALPISLTETGRQQSGQRIAPREVRAAKIMSSNVSPSPSANRSEEHTSELQSPCNLVCRLLLEKKKRLTLTGSCLVHGALSNACSTI